MPGLPYPAFIPQLALAAALLAAPARPAAQQPAGTTSPAASSSTANTQSGSSSGQQAAPAGEEETLREQASDALEHSDFPAALRALKPLVNRHPSDPRLRFDLASTEDALDQTTGAEADYRAASALEPTYLEPHLGLGLLLARTGSATQATAELELAANNTSGDRLLRARAFRALAHLNETSNPSGASADLLEALKLSPETADDQILAAHLASRSGDLASAEAAYRHLLAASPNNPAVTAELAELLLREKKPADAEAVLEKVLAASPKDPVLSAQLASLYAQNGDPARGLALVQPLHEANPNEASLTRLEAHLLTETGDYTAAEPLLTQLHSQNPTDADLTTDLADTLIHLKRPSGAQTLLQPLVFPPVASASPFPNPAARANAASQLAFAASQNNDPNTVLHALAVRATVLPQSPATLFLEAIARDKLHQTKEAQQLYQKFLAAANGKFPNEEWEARHRLVALGHTR